MKQKLIKIGNSVGFILPKHIQQEMGLKLGDSVAIQYNAKAGTTLVEKEAKQQTTSELNPEFYDWLKRFNKKYKSALTDLAKK